MSQVDGSDDQWFRRHLVESAQKSTELFDKAVLTLSGGALSVSLLLLDRISRVEAKLGWCLLLAWSLWAVSLASSLFSHWCSTQALRVAINEFDHEPHKTKLGGWMSPITGFLTLFAGLAFLAGMFAFLFFVMANYKGLFNGSAK
jgi:hypothetical protein